MLNVIISIYYKEPLCDGGNIEIHDLAEAIETEESFQRLQNTYNETCKTIDALNKSSCFDYAKIESINVEFYRDTDVEGEIDMIDSISFSDEALMPGVHDEYGDDNSPNSQIKGMSE